MECSRFDFACHFEALLLRVNAWFLELYSDMLQSIAATFAAIPMPSFVNGSVFGSLASDVLFFAAPFQLGTGAGIVLGAYAVRFLIRRLPIIG